MHPTDPAPRQTLSRRAFLATSATGVAVAVSAVPAHAALAPSDRVQLLTAPQRVYKLRDNGRENSESWMFHLMVQTAPGDTLAPIAMDTAHLARGQVLETAALGEAAVAALRVTAITTPTSITGERLAEPMAWQVYRIRASRPLAAGTDEVRIDMRLRDARGEIVRAAATVAIGTYAPRTSLIFPFRGRGFVSNAQANDGGHPNRSGQFAIDALGVDETYAPVTSGEDVNTAYVGWGREIIAPAAGTVVRVRADRPDQPVPNRSDPAFFAPEYPNGGDVGNHVVIDHGNGEFSLIAHMMAGSVSVTQGAQVTQGQPVGRLGNSGDAYGPHVHYQLQSGPEWRSADALTCTFTNVSAQRLVRGTWFTAT
jgi:hypothetical protein